MVAVLVLAVASRVSAQTRTLLDSANSAARWQQHGWISGGLGLGTWPYGFAGVAAGWYSVGPVAAGVRSGGASEPFGEARSDRAFLVGARTTGSRSFLLGAAGLGRVASSRSCDCSGRLTRPSATAVAYSLEAHGNLELAGIGVVVFGVFGPKSVAYNAMALTLNAGWFGP